MFTDIPTLTKTHKIIIGISAALLAIGVLLLTYFKLVLLINCLYQMCFRKITKKAIKI